MNKVLEYFDKLNKEPIINKKINVAGWKFNFEHQLISSITPYLFEELNIIEHLAPLTNENRDKRIKEKVYITLHDTGDTIDSHTAKFWSDTVFYEKWIDSNEPYKASYQYVVGNDGIYHNIPDNEVAYHAGDTTQFDYKLYDTGLKEQDTCSVSIDEEGYYTINNQRTKILAPIFEKEKNGVLIKRLCTKDDINDQGICVVRQNGSFYIGETYFNKTYEKIANRGGNNNSIGIESCVNQNTNIYYTWQLTAKLIARLLDENNLTIKDIKQHHYFSGKNCPQTMRENNLYDHVMHLVEVESKIKEFIKEGYTINLYVEDDFILPNGIIKNLPNNIKEIKYKVETIYNNVKESHTFIKLV